VRAGVQEADSSTLAHPNWPVVQNHRLPDYTPPPGRDVGADLIHPDAERRQLSPRGDAVEFGKLHGSRSRGRTGTHRSTVADPRRSR